MITPAGNAVTNLKNWSPTQPLMLKLNALNAKRKTPNECSAHRVFLRKEAILRLPQPATHHPDFPERVESVVTDFR